MPVYFDLNKNFGQKNPIKILIYSILCFIFRRLMIIMYADRTPSFFWG